MWYDIKYFGKFLIFWIIFFITFVPLMLFLGVLDVIETIRK